MLSSFVHSGSEWNSALRLCNNNANTRQSRQMLTLCVRAIIYLTSVYFLRFVSKALRGTFDREPGCSVDKLSVCVCLIGCLGGILTEFQSEFV